MFQIQNGKIKGSKTLDIGKTRIINLVFKSVLQFADDDKFKLVLGSIQSENYAFVDDGCLRFSYVDVADVIKNQSANFAVQILHNGAQILADTITITAVGDGQIVLPDVTVTADKMLKDITAINTDGDVVTGNIENAVITETETEVTVSRGFLNEDKSFTVGGGSGEEIQGVVCNAFPLNQSTQVKFIPSDITKDVTSFSGGFRDYKNLTSIPLLDTSNGTNFNNMFGNCSSLTSIPQLDTSNGTNFSSMFSNCRALTSIPQLDTSNGTNFGEMFYNCKALTSIPLLDTSNGTHFSSMFRSCSALTSIPLLDTSNGTDFRYMFNYCSKLTSIPQLDTSNGTDFNNMFSNCSALTSIPLLDTSNGTNFNNMFGNCSSLTSIPQLDTSNGTTFREMFGNCSKLTSIPLLDTSNGTNFSYMFNYCTALTSIPQLDTSNGTDFGSMFYNCSALTDFGGLLNVKKSYSLSSCTNLTHESLLNALNGLYDLTGSTSQTLTLGSTNLDKLTDQEKAIATNKNWVLA